MLMGGIETHEKCGGLSVYHCFTHMNYLNESNNGTLKQSSTALVSGILWQLFSSKEIDQLHKMINVEQLIVFKKDVEIVDFDRMRVVALEPLCQSTKRSLTDKSAGTWIGPTCLVCKKIEKQNNA